MEWLQSVLDNCDVPVVTAFVLGLLTAISPCPLATNIAAVGYISKDAGSRHRVFLSGVMYTLGRVLAYSALGVVLIVIIREGISTFAVQKQVSKWGEAILPWALIAIGLLMLFAHKLPLPKFGVDTGRHKPGQGLWGALLLGLLFALAFCPSSGIFYFGMLMPMSAAATAGYLLPPVFAVATGLPVVVVAWILAYSIRSIGDFYNRMRTVQRWLNVTVALLFILVGVYYLMMTWQLI